jgi:tetratricopeptide (TPR) repeat protein
MEKAETFFVDALQMAVQSENIPAAHAAQLNLSALFSHLGRYDEAIEHCESLSADPTFAAPWRPLTNCGWAQLQLGRFEEARTSFEEALSYFPRFGPALLNLGILLNKQGHTLAAIKMLQRALDSGRLGASALAEAHYRLGEIYVALGRRDKAVVHFREATDKAPFAEWSTQSQAYLDLLH